MGVSLIFKRILVANDGSPYSYAAWDEAQYITQRVGARLIAMNKEELEIGQAIVHRMQEDAGHKGLALEPVVVQGRPHDAIVQAARDHQADLVVIGALGKTGVTSLLMGSVTERVIAQAPCSVMVVKRTF